MPAMTGSRTLATAQSTSAWGYRHASFVSTVQNPVHLQIAGTVPADGAAIAGVDAVAARKRDRPPRGEPR